MEMNPTYQLASTLNIQEQVLAIYKKRLLNASRNYATSKRKGFTFGQADPKGVSAENEECDLTDMSLPRRCRRWPKKLLLARCAMATLTILLIQLSNCPKLTGRLTECR